MSEPVLQNMIPCQYASEGQLGRWSLVDVFDAVRPPSFPFHFGFCVYVAIADPPINGSLVVQVEEQPSDIVLWTSGRIPFSVNDVSLKFISTVLKVGPLTFSAYGKCRIAAFVGADRIGDIELLVAPPLESAKR